MSGMDVIARGLATQVRSAAATRTRVLLATGQSGPVYGAAGAGYVTVAATTLAAGAILGGATLRFRMLLAKYQPFNAGHQWRLRLVQGANAVVLAQNAVGAAMATVEIDQHVYLAHDGKAGFTYSLNGLDTPSLNTAGTFASTGAKGSATASLGVRQPATGSSAMFVSNSAPPTVETVLIDFTRPVAVQIDLQVLNGDTAEVLGATLELVASGDAGANFASARATAIWGDSLTEGTGATAVSGVPMDLPAQLRRQRPGWPIAGKGLGGQKSAAIVDRLLADPIAGRQWRAVLWVGTNDFDDHVGDGPGWLAAVRAQVDRALAVRGGAGTIVCTLHPRASWAVGDANYAALLALNAGLAATYGARVCDLFAALATSAGKVPAASMYDDVHLSNAGYTAATQAIDARMTALGWG